MALHSRRGIVGAAALSAAVFVVLFFDGGQKQASADIYRYIDSRGVIHFTNAPTDPAFQLYMKEGRRPEKHALRVPPSLYEPMISEAARRHGVSADLLKALIKVESDFNARAVSRAGALGLMQIMPENLSSLQIRDPFDPWENIMGGTRYLTQMLRRFSGKLPLALAAYNAGPSIVERYNRIPPIRETEEYVEKVIRYYHAFRK
ncbi:MAG: lytic transglycosylase domain-containing protein [Desulfobacterales bacterium]|nr:lytic transglycosylase domain-containing protein [Desulfobacterales bacterium]